MKSRMSRVRNMLHPGRSHMCHEPSATQQHHRVAIVGSPNVGKSVLFNALTGAYVTVSNYPGTTVEISRGKLRLEDQEIEVFDTPGMYSLSPVTEEERVARAYLMQEKLDVVIHVVDAKNLRRMLPFTLQLIEAQLPLILVVNIMDEAAKLGMKIDCAQLEEELGIPVVPAISVTGEGIGTLKEKILERASQISDRQVAVALRPSHFKFQKNPRESEARYQEPDKNVSHHAKRKQVLLEETAERIVDWMQGEYGISRLTVAKLLLNEDEELLALVRARENERYGLIQQEIKQATKGLVQPAGYLFWQARQKAANRIVDLVSTPPTQTPKAMSQMLSRLMMRPLTGIPILIAVLYFGLYVFVGKLGGGILVDLLQNKLFAGYVDPWVTRFVERIIPWVALQDLFVHDYGIITLGVKYAFAIILPIVAAFFLVFSIIEDTGYLPRLALLIDRFFKAIGLSGRAVIPMVLGLGCGTMATLVTRVLETRRERVLATLLLALAIPCSAQLGVVMGLLSKFPLGLAIWAGVVTLVALFIGLLSSRLLKGHAASFYIEVPPLRWPKLSNIATKTFARMQWYFLEIMPLFILASVLIWLGQRIVIAKHSIFDWIIQAAQPFVAALGLPKEAAVAFLFGFFRRDYGAAGIYELHAKGILDGVPLLVAMVTLTLFLPCVAQLLVMQKERGTRTTLAIVGFIFPFAWLVGVGLYQFLTRIGVQL